MTSADLVGGFGQPHGACALERAEEEAEALVDARDLRVQWRQPRLARLPTKMSRDFTGSFRVAPSSRHSTCGAIASLKR